MRLIDPKLKMALDYGPLLLFLAGFLLFKNHPLTIGGHAYNGIVAATILFVPAQVAAVLIEWRLTGSVSAMQMVTLIVVVVFGGLSVWFDRPEFIQRKPTIIYLFFATVLAVGLALGRNWLGMVLGHAVAMTETGWRIFTLRLIAMFVVLAVANEAAVRLLSQESWVLFKTVGLTLVMFAFIIANAPLFRRHALPPETD